MKIELWKSMLHTRQMLIVFMALIILLLSGALVTNGIFRSHEVLHIVPMQIQQAYSASAMDGDEQYRKAIALSLLPWIANVTPASVEYTHKLFMSYVPPDLYGVMGESLGAEAVYVKKHNLNRVFFPTATRVSGDEIIVQGMERRFVGKTETQEEEREYHITLRFQDWKPWVVAVRGIHLDRTNNADGKSGESEAGHNG
jgi:conjugal transfer pilus assembly protein TraE